MDAQSLEQLAAQEKDHFDITRAALLLAREVQYPDLDVEYWLGQVGDLAETLRPRVERLEPGARLDSLVHFLFEERRFRGNRVDYFDPRNSFLNDVLERRLGIPVTLSLLLVETGCRLGLRLFGVGLPGHFIAGGQIGDGRVYLDAFNRGARLDVPGMASLVEEATGEPATFDTQWLRPITPRQFIARMCSNLQGVYVMQQDWSRAVLCTQRLFLFTREPHVLRDLGYLSFQAGRLVDAADAFQSYLIHAPEAEDMQTIQENLASIFQKLARLN